MVGHGLCIRGQGQTYIMGQGQTYIIARVGSDLHYRTINLASCPCSRGKGRGKGNSLDPVSLDWRPNLDRVKVDSGTGPLGLWPCRV